MSKFNKFILPLALVKIILAFLVLQLFFSSCEKDDILYGSDLYTEGPVFEIEASLGTKRIMFEGSNEGNVMEVGDTFCLLVEVESNILFDEITSKEITLNDPEYHMQFSITNSVGEAVFPTYFEHSGIIDGTTSDLFNASFANAAYYDMLMSPLGVAASRLELYFIVDVADTYTFHFINTPSDFISSGTTDILYDSNPEDEKDVKKAYAVYLFDLGDRTIDYALHGESHKEEILAFAGVDQAIIDFTVIEKE